MVGQDYNSFIVNILPNKGRKLLEPSLTNIERGRNWRTL